MAQRFRGYQTASDFDMRYTDRCPSDSDPSEAPSDDSDNSSAPPRRYRATQKGSRARANKVRTLNRWTTEEHDKLAYLVDKWGSEKNWAKVAEEMPGRTGKQCRERWLNHMKPGIVKGNWSPEEEFLLAQCHALVGSHWSKMTKRLPGRTENSIKNFWNATLRSKAPNKKRGMLWTYMQLHDPKSDDNTLALVTAVSRLHETRELPPHLLAQMDEGLLDSRTWKAIHKAEKEFLENVGGELHYLSLPHPSHGLGMPALLQGYCGGAAGAVVAAAGASPAGSPVQSSSQIPEYSYSQGNAHVMYSTSYVGHKVGGMAGSHSYLQPAGTSSHYSSAVDVYSNLQGGMSGDGLGGLLSSAVPGAVGVGGLQGSSGSTAAAAAAAGSYGLPNLLTAQDPLLSCQVQDSMGTELIKMFEAGPNSSSAGASGLGSCATLAANNGAVFAAAADSAAAAAGVLPPPKELAPIITTAVKTDATSDGSTSTYVSQMGPSSTAATNGKAAGANGTAGSAELASAAYSSHLQQRLSPVNSCEPGALTGTPINGSPLLNTISSHELPPPPQQQQQQQQVAAAGAGLAGIPASAAYCSSGGVAAVADYARRQAGSPAHSDTQSDISYGMAANASRAAAGSRPAGGHGPHCSCGPCSNSRKLHGLHSPSARRNARNNATNTAASQRYRSMAALTHNDAVAGGYQASKLQRQSYMTQSEILAAPGYHLGHMDAHSAYQMAVQQQQQQQYYADASMLQQQQQQGVMAAGTAQDYSAVQPAAYQQYVGNAGMAAAAAAPSNPPQAKQQQQCESPFAQQAAAGWDVAAAAEGVAQSAAAAADVNGAAADAVTAEAIGSMPWLSNADTQQQQQQQQGTDAEQQDFQAQQQSAAAAAGQMPAPPPQQPQQQQQPNDKNPPPIKGLDLSQLVLPGMGAADALTGFLLSPMGLGLLSPLGGLMLPPPSTRSVRLPSFGQITLPVLQRASINGCDWDWDALMGSDSHTNVAASAAAAAAAAGSNPRSARPSENGDCLTTALACNGALGSAPRTGVKRARCSLTSVDDEGALLIDMQPAKVPRGSESSASGTIYGCGNGWNAKDFLNRFD